MKISQKAKYIGIGAVAMTVAIPVIIKATDAVPITFSQGDILSAEVLNTLLGRLNDVQKGFESNADLVGSWSCTTVTTETSCTLPFDAVSGSQKKSKTQTVTFSCIGNTCSWTASDFFPGSCSVSVPLTQNFELLNHWMVMFTGLAPAPLQKINPTTFDWYISSQTIPNAFARCTKQSQPPAPPTTLSATATGTTVVLTWVDQSTDETGFKVQTKTAVNGTWTLVGSATAAGVQTLTATATAGNNWYRVLATNANGDSITSNEILVEVQ